MNTKLMGCFVLLTVLFLTIGAASATDLVSNDTFASSSPVTDTIESVGQDEIIENNVLANANNDDTSTSTITDNSIVTVGDNEVINGNGSCYTNTSFKVTGDNVVLTNFCVNNNNFSSTIIDASGVNNLTIANVQLTTTNTVGATFGIDFTGTTNSIIANSTITVNAPSQTQVWKNDTGYWYSTLPVSAVLIGASQNINATGNTISIASSTPIISGSTMPAVTIKNNSQNIKLEENEISASGASYVYGIMMNDVVNNINVLNNNVTVTGPLYVAGIDASTSSQSTISSNKVIATSNNPSGVYTSGSELLAYGIILANTGNTQNNVTDNTITLTGNVAYAIENIYGTYNNINNNQILINAKRGLGIATHTSNNNHYDDNNITINCNKDTINSFYEMVTPQNVGIIILNSTNNSANYNTILINETSTNSLIYASILDENSTDNNVTFNHLATYNTNGIVLYGDSAVDYVLFTNRVCNNSNIITNLSLLKKDSKNVKTSEEGWVVVNQDNISSYSTTYDDTIWNVGIPNNSKFIIDLQDYSPLMLSIGKTVNATVKVLSTKLYGLQFLNNNVTLIDSYLPNTILVARSSGLTVVNSTLLAFKNHTQTSRKGGFVNLENSTYISQNVENGVHLITKDYQGWFDAEVYEDVFDSTTHALNDIEISKILIRTNIRDASTPEEMIINKPINITGVLNSNWMGNITFASGSEGSNITDMILNGTVYINTTNIGLYNNTFNKGVVLTDAADAVIEGNTFATTDEAIVLTKSVNSEIKDNSIVSGAEYAVVVDSDSIENTITGNTIYAMSNKGDAAVSGDKETNTISGNYPLMGSFVLNDGNWTEYFDDDGTVQGWIAPGSELRFEGTFTNRSMLIDAPFNLTTADNQAIFNNCMFVINASDVNVTNIQMNGEDIEVPLVFIYEASNVRVENNTLTLTNNGEKVVTHAINVMESQDVLIKNNIISTVGPEEDIVYTSKNLIDLVYTSSIYTTQSNGVVIDSNNVTTKSNGKSTSVGTIYGINVMGEFVYDEDLDYVESDYNMHDYIEDVQIINNNIITESDVYAYGINLGHSNGAIVKDNNITSEGKNYADAFQGYNVYNTEVRDNNINITADSLGYGIIVNGIMYMYTTSDWSEFELSTLVAEGNVISGNTVNITANDAWGIEVVIANDNIVEENNITINTSNGIGIGFADSTQGVAQNNNININATQESEANNGDALNAYTTGIKITPSNSRVRESNENEVISNIITITAVNNDVPAINVSSDENIIQDNYLVAPLGWGDEAVADTGVDNTIENNRPSTIITDETYFDFFDENGVLLDFYNNTDLFVSGEFTENTVFIFDGVNTTITNDGTAVFVDGQVMTGNGASVVFDGLVFDNSIDAFVLESDGNVINNTIVTISSLEAIQGILVTGDNNIIANTVLNISAPSANVEYNPDYSVRNPAPAAITISSDNNLVDNVSVFFDGTEAIHATTGWDAPTVDGIYLVSSTTPINNNTVKDTNITVIGANYAYGINVGNARNTIIDNILVDVASDYYADAIQLFDADTLSMNGIAIATADSEAYGVYSTAMGTGYSQNINMTGLNVYVDADDATGALFEGTQNILIDDSEYVVNGIDAAVIYAKMDFMGNKPSNITVNNVNASVNLVVEELEEGEEEIETVVDDMLIFENADNILVANSTFTSNGKSAMIFANATQAQMNNVEVTNATIISSLITDLNADNVTIDNTDLQAVYFESEGNILNNSVIKVTSKLPLRVVEFDADKNTIMNTEITASIPSIDVPYDKDYVGQPLSSGLYISSSDNTVDNVTVDVDGSSAVDNSSYVSIDGIDVQSKGKNFTINNNILNDVTVSVKGSRYVYGINVGRANNTRLDNVDIKAESDYYADTLQLFDANDLTVTGKFDSAAGYEAYGVYATAMAVGTSKGITLTELDVTVEAPKATGVLIEGASDIVIAESGYDLMGENVTAVNAHIDWMGNAPSNILINELEVNIDSTGDANVMYFGAANNVTVTDNSIVANRGSHINFNKTTNGSVTDNYIMVGEMLETGIFGDYAVITTEEDTIVENNTPVSKVIDDLNDKISELEKQLEELTKASNTTLTIDPLTDAKYDDTILISGLLVDEDGRAVPGNITLSINGENVTTKADTTGKFEYEYTISSMADVNVSAVYDGTEKFAASNATATISVGKQDTSVIFDDIEAIVSGETATITGQLVDGNGKGFYGTVKLLINNGRATVKTDKEGYFTYNTTLTKVGINNITGNYLESAKYNAGNGTTTVTVTPLGTSIVFDEIVPTKSGETVTITGKLTDDNGNPVVGTIKLLLNNGRATVKTDANGVFTYDYVFTKVGINNITATYMGANRYTESTQTLTVEITPRDTILTIDSIKDAKKGETVTITGKLTDDNGEAVVGTIKLTINGARATVKTDENGVFTYEYTVTKVGVNNITASYLGANRYSASNTSTTVKVNKAGTQITLNPIKTVTQKTNVDIKGQLSDENGNGIYGTVKLLINNGRATVKTDKTGAFTYSYNATRAGENTIKANYLESNNYEASETNTTFTVVKA